MGLKDENCPQFYLNPWGNKGIFPFGSASTVVPALGRAVGTTAKKRHWENPWLSLPSSCGLGA